MFTQTFTDMTTNSINSNFDGLITLLGLTVQLDRADGSGSSAEAGFKTFMITNTHPYNYVGRELRVQLSR